jgi:hypothetical protein
MYNKELDARNENGYAVNGSVTSYFRIVLFFGPGSVPVDGFNQIPVVLNGRARSHRSLLAPHRQPGRMAPDELSESDERILSKLTAGGDCWLS